MWFWKYIYDVQFGLFWYRIKNHVKTTARVDTLISMLGIPRNSLKLHTCSSLSDHWLLITKTWWYNIIINTSNVDIKLWDNYALLQIISEYFSAFGRSLNCVKIFLKKREFFCGIETCQNRAARWSWIWIVVDPGNEFAITHDAMLWNARLPVILLS